MNPKFRKPQSGMAALTMILLIVILLAVIGTVIAYSRGSPTVNQTAKLLGTSVIDQGNTYKDGFDLMVAKGTDIDTISFDTTVNTGLFNPITGAAIDQAPTADAVSAVTTWTYGKGGATGTGLKITGVGTPLSSYAIILLNVKDAVCKQINRSLHNVDENSNGGASIPLWAVATPVPASRMLPGGLDLTANVTTTALKDIYGADISGNKIDGWYAGCIGTGVAHVTDQNMYYNIIKPF